MRYKIKDMPEISRFYGIIIYLYWRDHNPPHIHFAFGDYQCTIDIAGRTVEGNAPAKVINKVNKWLDIHAEEVMQLWKDASAGKPLRKIKPLK